MIKNKKLFLKNLILLIFLFSSVKITYLFGGSLGGDDLSYWLYNTSLIIDKDWNFINEIYNLKLPIDKVYGTDVPLHSYGSSLISIPFVSLFYFLDLKLNSDILSNPSMLKDSYMFVGYFITSSFAGILSVYIIARSIEELKININKMHLLIISLGSSYYYFIFHRFTLNHTFEVLVNSLIIFMSILFFKKREKKYLFYLSFFIFLSLNIRVSNYNILFFPIIIFMLFNDVNNEYSRPTLKEVKFFITWSILFFCSFGLINFILYGSILRTKYCTTELECTAFLHPFFGQNISDMISSFKELLIHIDTFFFSFGPGLIWSFPLLIITLFFLFLSSKRFSLKFYFLVSISIPFLVTLFWRGRESEFNPRFLVGLIPVVVVVYFYLVQIKIIPNIFYRIMLVLSSYNIFNQLFFHTNEYTTLSSEISYLGLLVPYSNKDINKDIFFQLIENNFFIPNSFFKSLLGIDLVILSNFFNNNLLVFISELSSAAAGYIITYTQIDFWILLVINIYVVGLFFFIKNKFVK